MLIARAPLRITFAGGGTDLPSYYSRSPKGGFCVTAAIDKYVMVAVHRPLREGYTVRYRNEERTELIGEIRHPIVRAALEHLQIGDPLEIGTQADVPAGTGLGSSAAFTTALLLALHALRGDRPLLKEDLAEEAFYTETVLAGQLAGKQDAYASAQGGVRAFDIAATGEVLDVELPPDILQPLEQRLLLFYTGAEHTASVMLADQNDRCVDGEQDALVTLDASRRLGENVYEALSDGRLDDLGRFMHQHWRLKKQLNAHASTPEIDAHYRAAIVQGGAVGGKLIGAGGGGFLLFYSREPERLRHTMAERGLSELPFRFNRWGASLCHQ